MTGFSVTKCMTTQTAHRLCNYSGKCAHIHGHSYRWEVTAAREDGGVSPKNGIAIDFSELKAAMKECIYDIFDHALVLWNGDPFAEAFSSGGSKASDGSPQKIVWMKDNPTAEVFAKSVAGKLQNFLLANPNSEEEVKIEILRVRVWETADSYAQWLKG